MDNRSKQVYFILMYIRYVLNIHTCFKLARQTYFDYLIHVLKNQVWKNTSFVFDKICKTQKWIDMIDICLENFYHMFMFQYKMIK